MVEDKDKIYTINNFKIVSVKEGPSGVKGDEKKTPWMIINFKISHSKATAKTFQKFVNPNKPNEHPYAGAKVESMTFKTTKKGDFTNYNVEEITYAKGFDPKSKKDGKSSGTKAGDPMPFDDPPPGEEHAPPDEEKAPPEEITDTAPAKPVTGRMAILTASIDACARIAAALIGNDTKGKISWESARDMVAQGSIIMVDDILKGLERWNNA